MSETRFLETARLGIIAGAAGGFAEITWVTLYAAATGGDPAALARGVTTASGITALLHTAPVALGLAVHMALAVMLGIVLTSILQTLMDMHARAVPPYSFMLTALAGVWALNYFVVLPIVSPAFIHMVPYPVSLISKLLFGVAAAQSLLWQGMTAKTVPQPLRRHVP